MLLLNLLKLAVLFFVLGVAVWFSNFNSPVEDARGGGRGREKERREAFIAVGEPAPGGLDTKLVENVYYDVFGFYPLNETMQKLQGLGFKTESDLREYVMKLFTSQFLEPESAGEVTGSMVLEEDAASLDEIASKRYEKYKAITYLFKRELQRLPSASELEAYYKVPLSETYKLITDGHIMPISMARVEEEMPYKHVEAEWSVGTVPIYTTTVMERETARTQAQPSETDPSVYIAKVQLNRNLDTLRMSCENDSSEASYKDMLILPPAEFRYQVQQVINDRAPCDTPLCKVQPSTDQTALIGTLLDSTDLLPIPA